MVSTSAWRFRWITCSRGSFGSNRLRRSIAAATDVELAGHELASRYGALRLLNGGGLHQCPEVLVDRPFARVVWLEQAAQEHCRGSNVLTGLSELRGIGPPNRGVALDLTGVTPSAVCRSMRMERSVVRRARWCSQWLMRPLSS